MVTLPRSPTLPVMPEPKPTDAPNTTVLPEGALQPTTMEQAGGRKVISVIDTLLNTPNLPTGTMVTPQLQQVQTGEAIATPGVQGTVAAATPTPGTTPTVTAATVPGATMAAQQTAAIPGSITAATVAGQTPTMTAAQATGLTAPAVAATGTIESQATILNSDGEVKYDKNGMINIDELNKVIGELKGINKEDTTYTLESINEYILTSLQTGSALPAYL